LELYQKEPNLFVLKKKTLSSSLSDQIGISAELDHINKWEKKKKEKRAFFVLIIKTGKVQVRKLVIR